jgi:hypothetical protein
MTILFNKTFHEVFQYIYNTFSIINLSTMKTRFKTEIKILCIMSSYHRELTQFYDTILQTPFINVNVLPKNTLNQETTLIICHVFNKTCRGLKSVKKVHQVNVSLHKKGLQNSSIHLKAVSHKTSKDIEHTLMQSPRKRQK